MLADKKELLKYALRYAEDELKCDPENRLITVVMRRDDFKQMVDITKESIGVTEND